MKSMAKVAPALATLKVPVVAAAMANWKETTPDASLSKASPDNWLFWRRERLMSPPSAATATASVGPSAAPSAKAAASGMEGCSRFRVNPTLKVRRSTRPMASESMPFRFAFIAA